MTRRRRIVLAAVCAAVLLLPGWRAGLREVPHAAVLAAARDAPPDTVFGVVRHDAEDGAEWHAQYHGSALARLLHGVGMGGSIASLLPPDLAAHVPAGAERADGYFEVVAAVHWPWWLPGGGVDWRDPRAADGSSGD